MKHILYYTIINNNQILYILIIIVITIKSYYIEINLFLYYCL